MDQNFPLLLSLFQNTFEPFPPLVCVFGLILAHRKCFNSHVEIRAGLVMLGALKFAANTGEQEEEK